LVTEDKKKVGEKRVTFKIESRKRNEESYEILKEEILTEVRREIKKEIKELETRLGKRMEDLSVLDEVNKLGEILKEKQKRWEEGWERKWEEVKDRVEEIEREIDKAERRLRESEREEEVDSRRSRDSSVTRMSSEWGRGLSREGVDMRARGRYGVRID